MSIIRKNVISVSHRKESKNDIIFSFFEEEDYSGPISIFVPHFYETNICWFGSVNTLESTEVMIAKLKSIINRSDHKEFDFSTYMSEKFITTDSNITTIEHWDGSREITTKAFLEIFIHIRDFLKRWINKKELLNAIKKAFMEMQKQDFKEGRIFVHIINERLKIKLLVLDDQLTMDPDEFVNSLELPVHMLEMQSNSDESE